MLGAFGPHLAVLAHFFETPWRTPRRELKPADQAWLLSSAAFALTALGRLSDSVEPRRAGLEARHCQRRLARTLRETAANLTDTLLTLGRVAEAVDVAEQAVTHADRSGDEEQREYQPHGPRSRPHRRRRFRPRRRAVRRGGGDQGKTRPDDAQLYSLQGYQYGDLILARGDAAQALERGRYQLGIAERYLGQGLGLHDIGFGHLLIGRAQDALGDAEAASSLDAAVAGLRKSGMTDYLPQALLARAAHRRRRAASGETDLIERHPRRSRRGGGHRRRGDAALPHGPGA